MNPEAAIAAIQSRMWSIESRFAPRPAGVSFDDVLGRARQASRVGLSVSGSTTASGNEVVELASSYLGVPYVWGGDDPSGFDCSGFVQFVFRQVGLELPRVSADQAQVGSPVASLADARPGDLLAFNSPVDHIGIYAGDGQMIVAPKRGDVVKIQPVYAAPTAIRRVLPDRANDLPARLGMERAGLLASLTSLTQGAA